MQVTPKYNLMLRRY